MSTRYKPRNNSNLLWIFAALSSIATILGLIFLIRGRRKRSQTPHIPEKKQSFTPFDSEIRGLSESEAITLQQEGQDNSIQLKPQRSIRKAIREYTLSIFNLSLVGISIVQIMLGKPLDALLSLGVMFFNIALNTFQEFFARKRIEQVELATRIKATILRDGKTRSIDPSEIVIGDIVLIGPGDQLPIDGVIVGEGKVLIDDSALNIESNHGIRNQGEKVFAGSICLTGQTAVRTTAVGKDRRIVSVLEEAETASEVLTPIQKIIHRILRILLVIVAGLILMLFSVNYRLDLGLPSELLIDAASVIFSIAPAGLFFMILLTYAAGTADLAKLGALVRQARSVELLAQVKVMCFAKAGVLTGTDIEIITISNSRNKITTAEIAESRLRQLLGDFARSTRVPEPLTRAMVKSFEGNQRNIIDEVPFMSLYGWRAIVFDEHDLYGVYVLGKKDILKPYLTETIELAQDDINKTSENAIRKTIDRLGGLFKRSKDGEDRQNTSKDLDHSDAAPGDRDTIKVSEFNQDDNLDSHAGQQSSIPSTGNEKTGKNFFKRILGRVNQIVRRENGIDETEGIAHDQDTHHLELIFAYCSEIIPIHNQTGSPYLPDKLEPLCTLRFSESVHPEAVETITKFSKNELRIKIFSSEPVERTAFLLKQAGLNDHGNIIHGEITGDELAKLDSDQMIQAARENSIFGKISPQQAAQVVRALRADDQFVAVLGDGVKDVPSLRSADLGIALQTSSQAAMSQADIILLEDSPAALQRVLDKGQRIVQGLLDILKIYLAQVSYLALLILAVRFISIGFPYNAAQGSAIAMFTLTIPSLGLTLWAASGVMNSASLGRILRRFVIPSAITMSTAGMVAYRYFIEQTGDLSYTHITVTYTLVSIGLLLVIFIKPPGRLWAGGASISGDWRPTILVVSLYIAFLITTRIPLAQEYLKIGPLKDPRDYLIIGLVVICWVITLRIAYWFWPLLKLSERVR